MKDTKLIFPTLATMLVVGVTMFISCEKEGSNENALLVQTKVAEGQYSCGQAPHIQGPYNPGLTVLCEDDGLPHYCNYTIPGNCLQEVSIPGLSEQLDMVVSEGPGYVGKFFSGKGWKKIWPNLDSKIVEELATGYYYLHKIERSEKRSFYVATKSSKLEPGIDIYTVIPVVH